MQPKNYQTRVLKELSAYLTALKEQRDKDNVYKNSDDPTVRELAAGFIYTEKAWQQCGKIEKHYNVKNGIGAYTPDIYLKVPTGGGKTLLAVRAIGEIRQQYLNQATGITLWIVPSEQIYRQTLRNLKNRSHPYRQLLENSSGGRMLIRERHQPFTPNDSARKHIILLLMLPATNRENNQQLRMFKDSGRFDTFFPPLTNPNAHKALLEHTPNLDFSNNEKNSLMQSELKTSLGNVLRLHRPLIIVDEGQRTYSDLARRTIMDFNPSFILELSATPPEQCNVLTTVSGRELDREQMIKLDINLTNQTTPDWKQTLLAAVDKRAELEKIAIRMQQKNKRYIRPITLIQVERTGADQRDGKVVHSEDAREYLIQQCDILPHEIAVKSSTKNELGDIDLLAPDCPIRYIITKQALQEGWDCSFAYVLAVLSNLSAITSLTQLAGRVLRQPHAQKTGIKALDECYIYTNRENSGKIAGIIKKELEKEGLGDISRCIHHTDGSDADSTAPTTRTAKVAQKFQRFAGKVYLPQFVIMNGKRPRPLDYNCDIAAHLDWENLYAPEIEKLTLADIRHDTDQIRIGISDNASTNTNSKMEVLKTDGIFSGFGIDQPLMTRQLLDIVPNPWHAHAKTKRILKALTASEEKRGTINNLTPQARMELNFIYIIEEAKRHLAAERDKMAQEYFRQQVENGTIKLMLFTADSNGGEKFRIPKKITIRSQKRMNRDDGTELKKSLFNYVPEEDTNNLERSVALYLDDHARLLWWYRNQVHNGYAIQGWKRHQIYPDFIAATADDDTSKKPNIGEVLVIETKGSHLTGSEDTEYKRTVLQLCDDLCAAVEKNKPKLCKWQDLARDFQNQTFRFQMLNQDEWKHTINQMLQGNSAK